MHGRKSVAIYAYARTKTLETESKKNSSTLGVIGVVAFAPRGRAEPQDNDVRSNFEDSNIDIRYSNVAYSISDIRH